MRPLEISSDSLKEIKNSMLTSGIPLESSVAARLVELKWIVLENLPILLANKDTRRLPIKSEGDVLARKWSKGSPRVLLDLAIECEYRNPSTSWIFFKSQKYSSSHPEVYTSYLTTFKRRTSKNTRLQSIAYADKLISPLFGQIRPQSKALQVPGETNKAFSKESILKAVEQSVKAALNWKNENIPKLFDSDLDGLTTSIIMPMVVTTTRLLEFTGTTLSSVSKVDLKNLQKYFREVDFLLFDYQLPYELRFNDALSERVDFLFVPIINYYKFKSFVRNLEKGMKPSGKLS